ncbi:MAG: type II toxin-antitoxin system VapC family toxin [Terriglobales bacterium]
MILADTSVWIRHLADRESYRQDLHRLLQAGQVAGHEFVHGELLIGISTGRGREPLLSWFARIPWVRTVAHDRVEEMVAARSLAGRGLSWIDAHLLAAALVAGCRIWTADAALAEAAKSLGVGWRP